MKKDALHDEQFLLQELAKESREAFAYIYDHFYPLLFYYTRRRLEDADRANDVTSECFVKFWQSGKKEFDSLEGIKAYLLRSASNACINAQRNRQTELAQKKQFQHFLEITEGMQVHEDDAYKAALMRLVLEEIEKLPRQCRQIFRMSYFQDMKNDEIAQRLNLSNKTVRNHKTRALSLLRIALLQKKVPPEMLLIVILAMKETIHG